LELRAEITVERFKKLKKKLKTVCERHESYKRMSLMLQEKTKDQKNDIRIRVEDNDSAEVVVKIGNYHGHDRVEINQEIDPKQTLGFARIFGAICTDGKIIERDTHELYLTDDICMSLVRAGQICYVEIEKMSEHKQIDKDKERLEKIFEDYNLNKVDEAEFNDLCKRLTNEEDISFDQFMDVEERFANKMENYIG